MKRCVDCSLIFEDYLDVCPTCGERLEPIQTNINTTPQENISKPRLRSQNHETIETSNEPAYVFERQSGLNHVINGLVTETSTQQFYQSKSTKIFRAIFSGEPYQLSHTSFVTIFRVEENVRSGYPMLARDITVFGRLQNVFAVGDDVTINVRSLGNRLVARRIFNHSIESNVRIQPNIPALFLRVFVIMLIATLLVLINMITNADYELLGDSISRLIMAALPSLLLIGGLIYFLKQFFKQ